MIKSTVLVTVQDSELASAIRQSTEFANPGIRLWTAETGSEAHAILQHEPVSLAVTILPVRTGFEFVAIASERFPEMPHIVASCTQPGELDEIAVRLMDLLEHQPEEAPIDNLASLLLDELILQRQASGFLRAVPLLDVIRLIEADSSSVTLTLRHPRTVAMAVLFFRGGKLLDAHASESGGLQAVQEALQWDQVHISISSGCRNVPARINRHVSQIIEHSQEPAQHAEQHRQPAPILLRNPVPDGLQETVDLDALLQFTLPESSRPAPAPVRNTRLSAEHRQPSHLAVLTGKP